MLVFSWQDYSDMCFSIYKTGMIERDCALVKDYPFVSKVHHVRQQQLVIGSGNCIHNQAS
ncbi:hypothetical protein [Nostoc sp.]|uniref:hypothetical protein n=1 Tax=Nostoc sp. TaxID=1180 RepID=UPI002FFA9757